MMIHEYQERNEADVEEIWRRTAQLSLTEAEDIISSLKTLQRLLARLEVSSQALAETVRSSCDIPKAHCC
jgi:hypothetical protein